MIKREPFNVSLFLGTMAFVALVAVGVVAWAAAYEANASVPKESVSTVYERMQYDAAKSQESIVADALLGRTVNAGTINSGGLVAHSTAVADAECIKDEKMALQLAMSPMIPEQARERLKAVELGGKVCTDGTMDQIARIIVTRVSMTMLKNSEQIQSVNIKPQL